MGRLQVEYIPIDELKPYENNPRINDQAVEPVARSIEEFGFKVPIVIDKDNVIIAGHTRLKASQRLGLKEVPCIRADDLTADQVKAFRIADNSVSEKATWDLDKLEIELDEIELDMGDFGVQLNDTAEDLGDIEEPDWAEKTQERVENILNLRYGQYFGAGKYDIPIIAPVYELPEIREWIRFVDVLSDRDPEGKAVHFYVDDYKFERLWNAPERYVDKLRQYVCVTSPDFSPYGDMPLACQLFNHYRKHWVAAWLQENGVTVIPTIRCSTDKRSLEWFLDGEPKKSIITMSSMWSRAYPEEAQEEFKRVKEVLKPSKIFIYGDGGNMGIEDGDNVSYIKSFIQRWYKTDDNEQT